MERLSKNVIVAVEESQQFSYFSDFCIVGRCNRQAEIHRCIL